MQLRTQLGSATGQQTGSHHPHAGPYTLKLEPRQGTSVRLLKLVFQGLGSLGKFQGDPPPPHLATSLSKRSTWKLPRSLPEAPTSLPPVPKWPAVKCPLRSHRPEAALGDGESPEDGASSRTPTALGRAASSPGPLGPRLARRAAASFGHGAAGAEGSRGERRSEGRRAAPGSSAMSQAGPPLGPHRAAGLEG